MTRPIVVVGLLGRAGSGKSTAAAHLEGTFNARRHSMAWPLKRLAVDVFDFKESQVFGTQREKETVDVRYGASPRELLIRLGEGARKWVSPRVWVDGCLTAILESERLHGPAIHVIEDVRHTNEAELIKHDPRIRGVVIKLEYASRSSSHEFNTAPSEVSVDEVPANLIDQTIEHMRTPDAAHLKDQLNLAVARLVGPWVVHV